MDFISAGIEHLENSSEFLCCLTDTAFRFLHTNRLFQKQFELAHEHWKGRPFSEVVQTLQMEKYLQANNECINNPGKTICVEIEGNTASHEAWFRWEVSALVNKKTREVEGILFLGTDITKQKKAEQTMFQQAILLDNISDAIISADHNFCIKSWNLIAEMMFNLKYDQESNKPFHEISKVSFVNDSEVNFKILLAGKGYWNGSILIEKSDGTIFHMQTMVNALKDNTGQVTGYVAVSRDATKEYETKHELDFEQKRSQLDLAKEQQQFETFMEHAPTLAWINDEEGTLYYMNTLFKGSFGLTDNAIGKNIFDYYPPTMQANCFDSDQKVLTGNVGIETFEEGIDQKGEKIYYQVYKFPLGSHNKNRLIGGLAVNITGQVTGRMEIIKERNQFQSFMESAPVLAWITDGDGILYYMNSRFKNSFNYSDDHLNKKIGGISITEREKALLPHKDVLAKNKSVEFFQESIDKNQKLHYYKTYQFPIKDVDGNCLAGGQSIEITAELLVQRALEKSNELFEYVGKATRDVIWDWDLEENKIKRTGGHKNLFGYEMTDFYEDHQYDKVHMNDMNDIVQSIEDALNRDDSRWQMEYKYLCADSSYKIVLDQAYIIRDKNGRAVRMIGAMQDVTEERELQKQVLIAEIQKKKDVVTAVIDAQEKERNELSAELHDNVNQLLAASILYLKTAQKQKVIEASLISHSLDYVQKAINELRNISHNLTPTDLKMHGLATALKALAEKLHIPKSFEIKLVIGKLNENKLSQSLQLAVYRIVQESINNILKHANAGKVTIHLCEEDNNLLLTVTDNGKGFDLLTMQKGLGITNIFTRAENFGGSAEIISSPGKGCTWNVKIPVS